MSDFKSMFGAAMTSLTFHEEKVRILEGELAILNRQVEVLVETTQHIVDQTTNGIYPCDSCPALMDKCGQRCIDRLREWSLEQAKKGTK